MIWNGLVCFAKFGMVWYGTVWYGIVWYGIIMAGLVPTPCKDNSDIRRKVSNSELQRAVSQDFQPFRTKTKALKGPSNETRRSNLMKNPEVKNLVKLYL